MPEALRALRYPNYRIFLIGQGVALIGTWCQRIAILWLVYRTTGSAVLLGAAAFAAEISFLFIAPFGGLIADRVQRSPALMVVQVVSAVQAFGLALLVWAGHAGIGWVVALSLVLGICQAIEMPLRQAMFSDLVDDPRDLPNAIALMAFMNNAGRLIGPLVAGFLIGLVGENVCFALNGFGYLFVIGALLRMRLPARPLKPAGRPVLGELAEGFAYAWRFLPVRAPLALLASVGFCYLPYLVVMPVFTHQVLDGDSRMLGLLLSAAGVGAVAGLGWIAARTQAPAIPRLLVLSASSGGLGMLALAFAHSLVPALFAMAAVGFGVVVTATATATNIYLQTVAAPDKRGRVLGLFTMCFLGIAPIGNFVAGSLVEHFGCSVALLALGSAGLLGALAFARQRARVQALAFSDSA